MRDERDDLRPVGGETNHWTVFFKGRLVQYAVRVLRGYPGKQTAEVHDYHDVEMPVLAAALSKRAPGYVSLGFADPRGQVG